MYTTEKRNLDKKIQVIKQERREFFRKQCKELSEQIKTYVGERYKTTYGDKILVDVTLYGGVSISLKTKEKYNPEIGIHFVEFAGGLGYRVRMLGFERVSPEIDQNFESKRLGDLPIVLETRLALLEVELDERERGW